MLGQDRVNLDSILKSPWHINSSSEILDFYLGSERLPNRYGLYSQSLDRFLLVDKWDLWALVQASKILSSKISLIVCVFSSEEPPFKIENCLQWALKNKDIVLPRHQAPTITTIRNNSDLFFCDVPLHCEDDLPALIKEQNFALFVVKAAYAMRLTNLKLNLHPQIQNDPQQVYLNFFSSDLNSNALAARQEQTIWEKGFINEISTLLYLASSIDTALFSLNQKSEELKKAAINDKNLLSLKYFSLFFQLLQRPEKS